MKENEYAPIIIETHWLPESMKPIEDMAVKNRKTKGNDLHKSKLYKRHSSTNEKRSSAIRAKILRKTWERFTEDNGFRRAYLVWEIAYLIMKKNSLIPKK